MQTNEIASLLEYHHKDCYGWAMYCCNQDKELAADVLQSSYLKILEKGHTLKTPALFKTWAFKIISNTGIDMLRKIIKEKTLIVSDINSSAFHYDTGFENRLEKKLTETFFTEALKQLSTRQQHVLQLVFYHDMSLNQAADVLNISQGSVRQHYNRAKRLLMTWFRQRGITINNMHDGPI